jgi:hypothetical protein
LALSSSIDLHIRGAGLLVVMELATILKPVVVGQRHLSTRSSIVERYETSEIGCGGWGEELNSVGIDELTSQPKKKY